MERKSLSSQGIEESDSKSKDQGPIDQLRSFLRNPYVKWGMWIPWTLFKVAIYLLVTYSVVFTITLSYGAWKAYEFTQNEIAKIETLKTHPPKESNFMKHFAARLKGKYPKDTSLHSIKHEYVAMDSISLHLKNAVIAVEDASFYQHPGIHIESIINALETNKRRGKKSHGGSTISQQLSKNLFLTPEKTMKRKILELGYTIMMEKWLGKDKILELYLNYAQFGKNIFGCEAAAQHFYKKPCSQLNFNQSVQLASVLANPNKYLPGQRGSRLLAQRRRIIFENLYATRKISLEIFQKITGDNPRQMKEKAYRESIQGIQGTDSTQTINPGQAQTNGQVEGASGAEAK